MTSARGTFLARRYPCRGVCAVLALAYAVTAAPSRAADPSDTDGEVIDATEHDDDAGQRVISFGPTAGFFNGFGGGLRIGSGLGLEAFGGWLPLLITIKEEGKPADFDFNNTLMFSAHAYVVALEPTRRSSIGLLAGYKYNGLLEHGGTVGGFAVLDLNRSLALHLAGGAIYFPDGEDAIRAKQDIPDDATFSLPGPGLQFGANVGLLLCL
jgi:hypothetical protein